MVEFEIELKNEEISTKMDEIIEKNRKDFFIPGFRVGRAPNYLIRTRFKKELESETYQELASTKLEEVINQYKPFIYYGPALKDISKEEGGVKIKIEMEVPPKIEIDYTKLSKDVPTEEVKDEEIEKEIEKLREINATLKPVKRKIRKNDVVLMDIEFGEDKLTNYTLEVKDDELSNLITGMKNGEEKEFETEFSKEFFIDELKGKKGKIKVIIKDVKEKVIPDLNDEFAKTLGFNTIEEIRNNLKEELQRERKENLEEKIKEKVLDNLIETINVDVPEILVKRFESELKDKNKALKEAKKMILLDAIALKEKFEITDEDIDKKLSELSEGRIDEEKIVQYGDEFKDELKRIMLRDKAIEFLLKEVMKK
uniref:Trigger factor n=1 Tax=candidate division WOR-3 bacterium TaxID=2052148 RepID=A0A7C4U745_UNCW3